MRLVKYFLYAPVYGAYTELFAGLSPDVTPEKSGAYGKHAPSASRACPAPFRVLTASSRQ